MAHPQIAAFARLANSNAAPVRKIEGQETLLGRTMHSIAYDPIHDEFYVPQQLAQGILAFRGDTNGEEPPVRYIQGSLTQLQDPDHLDVDPVHNEIFVPEHDRVLVYSRTATGNVAPIRVLRGPDTQLSGIETLAVDPVHNVLVVGTTRHAQTHLLIFNRTDQGNVKPKAVIGGPNSGLATRSIGGPFAIYADKGEIVASLIGDRGSTDHPVMSSTDCFVGVWSVNDNGDVAPRWRIGGPNGILRQVRGVAIDAKDKSIIVSDKRLNAVMTFYFPEMF